MSTPLFDTGTYPVQYVLDTLLKDRSTGKNIIFATDSYADLGELYTARRHIVKDMFTGSRGSFIQPRVLKALEEQAQRTRKKAEVFTPAWVCCLMNDYLDEEWFFRKDVFFHLNGQQWTPTEGKITFPKRKHSSWKMYVDSRRLELTCGEAPYLVSRYDMATGEVLPINRRIGILDRKLRIVNENTETEEQWWNWTKRAFQSIYGYEYQGDSLLIARINLLLTFADYVRERWNREPKEEEVEEIAKIVSWNLWQMDGLSGTVPVGALGESEVQTALWLTKTGQERTKCQVKNWRQDMIVGFNAFREGGTKGMKFDFIIGNPPYQEEVEDSENKTFMPPVYNLFMDASYSVADRVELIHPARFLFNAGQTPKSWNEKMLDDPHFKIMYYEQDASKVFPNTYINGGIVVSYHSALDNYGKIGVFTAFSELNSILHKTQIHSNGQGMEGMVYNQNRFLLDVLYNDYPEYKAVIGSSGKDRRFRNNIFDKIPLFTDNETDNSICVFGVTKGKRTWKYFPKKYVDYSHENLSNWKVVISSADGAAGTVGHPIPARVLGEPVILNPDEGYTQTFIGIGSFATKNAAENTSKYLKTRFCRTLAGTLKITQHITPDTFKYVPLQDFTSASDIDWSQSIHDIDQQLYKKYGLTPEEIDFIETHVKEME